MSVEATLRAEGWALVPGALAVEAVEEARAWIEAAIGDPARLAALQPELDGTEAVRKIRRIHWSDPAFWSSWVCASGLYGLVASVVSEPALVFHAAFLKPPGIGSEVGFHQDQALWEAELPGAYSFWLPLERADAANAGIVVCPRSHRRGLIPHAAAPAHPWHEVVDPAAAGLDPVQVEAAPGDVVAWDRFMVHGSSRNTSARSRRAMVLVFVPDSDHVRATAKDHARIEAVRA